MRMIKRNANEKERNDNQQRERRTELGIFYIMRFDSATSRFLALLVTEIKKRKCKNQKKLPHLAVQKMLPKHFVSRNFCQVTNLRASLASNGRLTQKRTKKLKNFGTNSKFYQKPC